MVPQRRRNSKSSDDLWQRFDGFLVCVVACAKPKPGRSARRRIRVGGDFIVLATNALEFCRLLGLGYNELEWDDLAARPSEWKESQGLRNWLAERLRIDFPPTGEAIARNARERHPGFSDWMTAWQAANL